MDPGGRPVLQSPRSGCGSFSHQAKKKKKKGSSQEGRTDISVSHEKKGKNAEKNNARSLIKNAEFNGATKKREGEATSGCKLVEKLLAVRKKGGSSNNSPRKKLLVVGERKGDVRQSQGKGETEAASS